MKKLSLLVIICFISLLSAAQDIHVSSIQHVVRWVSETNFPDYTTDLRVQEVMRNATAEALKRIYKVESIQLPARVEYKYISGFGKASLNKPGNSNGYNVSVLSYITRANVGYSVFWKMEVLVQQNGKAIYSKQTEHELEYFNASGYLKPIPWMDQELFGSLFTSLIEEALGNAETLPAKIIIGSIDEIEKEAKQIVNQPAKFLLKTKGNFLAAGNFIMKVEKDDQAIPLYYLDGVEASNSKDGISELGAKLLSSITKLNIGYNAKSKQKRFGKLEYEDGKKLRLRMEWVEMMTKYTDGSTEPGVTISPMVVDVFDKSNLLGSFIFHAKINSIAEQKTMGITMSVPIHNFYLEGRLYENSIEVEYDPVKEFVIVSEDNEPKIVVLLSNINPDNTSFSGTKLSKKKITVSGSSQSIFAKKPKFENTEWYPAFADVSVDSTSMKVYAEAILLMFFAIGNQ
jgi:hypothetical protein